MNSTIKNIATFVLGGALGAGISWFLTKSYYDKHMQSEIDSVKEAYGRRFTKVEVRDEMPKEPNVMQFKNEEPAEDPIRREVDTHKTDYVQYFTTLDKASYGRTINFDPDSDVVAYIIDDREFGEKEDEGYHTMSLVYYLDDVLADYQDDEIIDNVSETVGLDWKRAFDKGEDIVYVRNDRRMCDYEILRSEKSYKDDILPTKPPTLEERHDL